MGEGWASLLPTPFSCRGSDGCGSMSGSICQPTPTILSATISEHAGRWYVSVLVEQEHVAPTESGVSRRSRPGCQDAGHPLGWHKRTEPAPSQAAASRSSSGCSAPSRASRKAVVIARRRCRRLGDTPSPHSQPARQHVTPVHLSAGENQVNRGDRRSQRVRHAQEPPPRASHRGRGLLRVPATTDL